MPEDTEGVLKRRVQPRASASPIPQIPPRRRSDLDQRLDSLTKASILQSSGQKSPTMHTPLPQAALLPSPRSRAQPALVMQIPSSSPPPKPAAPRTGCLVSCHWEQPTSLQGKCYFYPGNGWQLLHCSQPPPAHPSPAPAPSRALPAGTAIFSATLSHPRCQDKTTVPTRCRRRGKRYPELEACAALHFKLQ